MSEPKYETVEELAEAYDKDEIERPLVIDSDRFFIYSEDGECLFRKTLSAHCPHGFIEELLDYIGIPWRGP